MLGPNGSGKTTTIKLLLGLLFPTEGDAFIFGEPTTNVAKNERIGYLPEESYLYKFLNAEETLHFYGRLFKLSKAERTKRVGRLIDMVGLNAAKHRQLREYSKGMQRRIGLAQALINNPELILLDEPTSGLDPIGTAEIKELIRDLKAQGKTVVLSGHLLADMQDICDRIAILHRGELKEMGKVSDLLTVQDITQIKTRDLPEAAIQEIQAVIKRHGSELLSVDHPTTTLEELFLRIVRESDLHPGRRRVGDKPGDTSQAGLDRRASPRPTAPDDPVELRGGTSGISSPLRPTLFLHPSTRWTALGPPGGSGRFRFFSFDRSFIAVIPVRRSRSFTQDAADFFDAGDPRLADPHREVVVCLWRAGVSTNDALGGFITWLKVVGLFALIAWLLSWVVAAFRTRDRAKADVLDIAALVALGG